MRAAVLLAGLLAAGPAAAQTLDVIGPAGQHAALSAEVLAGMPHVRVPVTQHGQTQVYEGVLLGPILAGVGAAEGQAIKGRQLATVVRVTAADGYQVVLALVETDPGTRSGRVIVADREAGKPLSPAEGPFRLVVEDDLRPARSARQVETIEVLELAQAQEPQ
ncbi:MAG: molybdopterin-binding oxidoreductase [Phenylobacterium sp.]